MLDAKMERISDPKRRFAFTVQLRGVPEPLCFGTDDEQVLNEWISKLENASVTKSKHTCIYLVCATSTTAYTQFTYNM